MTAFPGGDGCNQADEKIKSKSSCFTCPFPDCISTGGDFGKHSRVVGEDKIVRDNAIRHDIESGLMVKAVAIKYGLSKTAIRKIRDSVASLRIGL